MKSQPIYYIFEYFDGYGRAPIKAVTAEEAEKMRAQANELTAKIVNYGGFYCAFFTDASGRYRGSASGKSKREIIQACKERKAKIVS